MFKKFLFSAVMLMNTSLFAGTSQGETLERQRWEYIKNHNWKDLDNLTAPYFQVSLSNGSLKKEHSMNLIKSMDISDYTLSDFIVTEGPGVSVVTYAVTASQNVEGRHLTSKTNRLSIWQNDNGKWQLIAHAVLTPAAADFPSKK